MSARFLLIAVIGLLIAAPVTLGDGDPTASWTPTKAFAVASSSGVIVTWAPGPLPADHYVVYGLRDGSTVPIHYAEITETTVEAEGGFPQYGIVGFLNGAPSPLLVATSINPSCIVEISHSPPSIVICSGTLPVRMEIVLNGTDFIAGP